MHCSSGLLALCLVAGLACGCGADDATFEIDEVRERERPRHDPAVTLSAEERFGRATREAGQGTDGRADLVWKAPPGWQARPARGLRLFSYVVDADTRAWCYGGVLRGPGGGLAANVNRWRSEMGRDPLSPAAIDALPRLEVLGAQGTLVEVAGDFRGTGGPALSDARLLGLICALVDADEALFVKMVGPAAIIGAERGNFEALCRSLRRGP